MTDKEELYSKIREALENSDTDKAIIVTWDGTGKEPDDFAIGAMDTGVGSDGILHWKVIEKLQRAVKQLEIEETAREYKDLINKEAAQQL